MTGTAQHWYYMLERDAGDISAVTWQVFRSLCQQRFGPPLSTNHLAELARLPFCSSVSEYQENFQSRMAHAGYLTPAQQVQLFTGGLPEPLRTDVELLTPTDLQRAMALARAFERRSLALSTSSTARTYKPPSHVVPSLTPVAAPTSAPPQPTAFPFKRLSPTEMAERRRQGLCYNCDEPYMRGHKCQRLFYLEVTDFDEDAEYNPTKDGSVTSTTTHISPCNQWD